MFDSERVRRRRIVALGVSVALAGTFSAAHAQPAGTSRQVASELREGTVVAIDAGELVIDLGLTKGVKAGDKVELWRPIRVRHPVTGAMLNERFRIGTLRLVQARGSLSLAAVEGAPTRPPATGDYVVAESVVAVVVAPEPAKTVGAATSPGANETKVVTVPTDPEAEALSTLMKHLGGAPPASRARAYLTFVSLHPDSPYAAVLRQEAHDLTTERARSAAPPELRGSLPRFSRARAGVAQAYALELDPRFVGAVIHARRKGTPAYRSIAMGSVGERYFAATLPGDTLADPGLEYFVEGVLANGSTVALVGSAQEPRDVEVETPETSVREPGQVAQVGLMTEIASFNVKKANDYVFQTEGTVGWRLHDEGIRAIRSGFGVLRGEGGSLRDLDELGLAPTSVGLTYGYLEAEVAFTPRLSIIGRPIVALRDGGVTGGAQGFVRFGSDLGTNLSIGGEVLGTVGQRGIVQLEWKTIPRVPIVLRTEVTNQPSSSSDYGARAIAQVGYQLVRDFTVAARVSYQGRTINHAGPGAGLAVGYQW